MSPTPNPHRHVLGDWGTTRLRLFLIEGDRVASQCEGPGIASLVASPPQILTQLVAPWRRPEDRLDVYLAGMVGSRNGWHEVPYLPLPTDCAAWCNAAWTTSVDGITVRIAGGLCMKPQNGAGDVMRGEEAQIFGALRADPALARGTRILVLPGTHSKWVQLIDGVITRFRTAFTGETYALFRDYSTLLRASATSDGAEDFALGFAAGSRRARELDEGVLAAVFEARTAQLLQGRSRAWAAGFLSGLLIAHEIDTLGNAYGAKAGVTIIGDPQLTEFYRQILEERACPAHVLAGDACVIEGLRYLAACARQSR
ncbi:MAG TPA: 2-dehydro-3-deoxygalactonokinase [Steroidobacteraceae bacterium]|jgi:2-keto-3-deoxy-galactonokinase|nr:2-dehydro-3-deoxygalactonokinase [Steroidobacteraceae bacterium]